MRNFGNYVLIGFVIVILLVCLAMGLLSATLTYYATRWEIEHGMVRHFWGQFILGCVLTCGFAYICIITMIDTVRYLRKEWVSYEPRKTNV